jgi:hypothetical protein
MVPPAYNLSYKKKTKMGGLWFETSLGNNKKKKKKEACETLFQKIELDVVAQAYSSSCWEDCGLELALGKSETLSEK